MNFRKFLLFIVFIIIVYLFFIKDFLYYRYGKEYSSGKVINISIVRSGMGTEAEIYYTFYVERKEYRGVTDVNYPWFSNSNLQVGDTVNCIYYCPRFPEYANGFDFIYICIRRIQ